MGETNYGNQTIIYDYKYPAKGKDFSKSFRGIVKPGIYSGFTLSKIDANTISIAIGTIVIEEGTSRCVKITTASTITKTVTEAEPVVYATFDWVDKTNNYADFLMRVDGAPVTNEVNLGKVIFNAGEVDSFEYTDKDVGFFDSDFNIFVDQITEKTNGSGVTVEEINFTDGNVTGVDSVILDDGYISGVSTISMDGNITGVDIATVDQIKEKTLNAGVTVEKINLTDDIISGSSNILSNEINVDKITKQGTNGVGFEEVNGDILRTKIIEIGDWNMDSSILVNVAHGLTSSNIRNVGVLIRNDADTVTQALLNAGAWNFSATNVTLSRDSAGIFDSIDFDSTSYNRGWIIIQYID